MSDDTVRIDLGCGKSKEAGWIGVDSREFPGVDVVCDLASGPWPWADNSVDEAKASHFVEHLDAAERVHFANEMWRVLKRTGKALIVTPHWASPRAYGDLTHKWPPVCEWWFPYLNKEWRAINAPHNDGYTCNFALGQPGYTLRQDLVIRNPDYQQYALANLKDAAQDMIYTLVPIK